jgi:hypothetical protein
MVKAIAPNAPSPAERQAELYRNQRVETRLHISNAALKASKTLSDKSGPDLIADGGTTLKTVAQAASLVHGWQEQSQQRVIVSLQAIEGASGDMGLTIEAPLAEDTGPLVADDPMDDPAFQ